MFLSFHEEHVDREGREECFGSGYMDDGFAAMSGEETGIGVLADARAGDQIAACEQIDDAAKFFCDSIRQE